jgi:uncharacterized protein YgiM (DUF1202 family)
MKMKLWSVYVMMVSTSLLAQQASNSVPAEPVEPPAAAPVAAAVQPEPEPTNAPAAKPAGKKAAGKKARAKHAARKAAEAAAELKTVPLVPGPAVVAARHVNVRGQAKLNSEVITRMTNGEPVTVIQEVTLKHSGPEEPSVWAKIALPEKAHAWVYASYIDATNKTVMAKKLNLRGGPGENYSVLGILHQGDGVQEIQTKGKWMEIEATTNAYAFMAAQYLTQEPSALAAAAPEQPAAVAEAAPAAEAATNTPAATEAVTDTNQMAVAPTNEMAAAATNEVAAAPPAEEPPPPRIVQREGIVRYTASIQAPTMFELVSPENHKPIDYLYTTSTNLDLNRYKGLHIVVTGEEGLDERWKNTPLIVIQRIQVIE